MKEFTYYQSDFPPLVFKTLIIRFQVSVKMESKYVGLGFNHASMIADLRDCFEVYCRPRL